ncbi:phosphomannomutase/phosphoglucosamine mutase [Dehalogenimonas sp. WBC-2]|nr:phosphomannomutase/phosphoglucosamine mutase [Dehalogenimonas sp. WBC-2]
MVLKQRLFGSSGIRRLADDGLSSIAFNAGIAIGERYKQVVVGGDTRLSTKHLKSCLFNGLNLSGDAVIHDAGMIPTPTLAYAARRFDVGLMVTASHNPPEYNGIKFWNPDGAAFNDEQEIQIESRIHVLETLFDSKNIKLTLVKQFPDAVDQHIERILYDFNGNLAGLKIVIDCGGGAASVITPELLQLMGATPYQLYCKPKPYFPRASEPTNESLKDLKQKILETRSTIGLAHDGDADRLVVLTDEGVLVPGDKLFIILARQLKVQEVVTAIDASMIIEESGLKVKRTRVGDSAISAELKISGSGFGGEPCGAWIFPKVSLCPDGIYAAAMVAAIASDQNIAKLVNDIPSYPIFRGTIKLDRHPDLLDIEKSLMQFEPNSIERTDGIRFNLQNGWLLVRLSGTEPVIRLTVESKSAMEAKTIFEKAEYILKMACA